MIRITGRHPVWISHLQLAANTGDYGIAAVAGSLADRPMQAWI